MRTKHASKSKRSAAGIIGSFGATLMILALQARLAGAVKDVVRRELGADPAEVSFQYPPKAEMGDLALTAPFDLAKQLRRKPREIAETLAKALARPARRRAGGGRRAAT